MLRLALASRSQAATAAPLRSAGTRKVTAAAAPSAPPATDADVAALVSAFQDSRRLVVLTGAGCSTESGVPDYRSPQGAYSTGFKPMTHQQFLASPANRARYWARSFYGWPRFSATQPNAAHLALAELEQRGWVSGLVTQNVDRLHSAAGSRRVLELHGTTHRVICLGCGRTSPRSALQTQLAALNPAAAAHLAALLGRPVDPEAEREQALRVGSSGDNIRVAVSTPSAASPPSTTPASTPGSPSPGSSSSTFPPAPGSPPQQRPDGDVELADAGGGFAVPPCAACGGLLKPDVVFFGDNIAHEVKDRAAALVGSADALLVVGSSVQVFSAFRLVEAAKRAGARLVMVNVGPTRADKLADLKVEARAGEVMSRLARHPSLQLPKLC
ncbi:hypothetical protein Agub_g5065 [Astrephomene gubernaculifera]|uniref:NAD-dependent protein deacylase n=1 Tax=Astrephomene gubernaculifera TaxID=47775 RepID=A0AAD3DNP8_9CHLO|nr:hypothetical protein Agub_g5065 [Astrephomene gubernaculifera]